MFHWKNVRMKSSGTIKEAIELLEKESLRIVLVVDENEKLLGTITDGDIRRALLRTYEMTSTVATVMNTDPITANHQEDRKTILHLMKKKDLLHIPLIDEQGTLVGMETLQKLTEKTKHENIVFLMAGGFGKRLLPLTLETPKPLLKVGEKPILETIVDQFIDNGFHRFVISTHYKAEMVREHFGDGARWGVDIQYVYEDEPKGTAGALGLLPDIVPELPVVVMNGDVLTKVNFEKLLKFHVETKGIATMCVREYDLKVPYGVVQTDGKKILDIVEKPVHKFFINAGIYVLEPRLVAQIRNERYVDMPDLLSRCVRDNEEVNMYPIHEYWLDIGNIPDYQRANSDAGTVLL